MGQITYATTYQVHGEPASKEDVCIGHSSNGSETNRKKEALQSDLGRCGQMKQETIMETKVESMVTVPYPTSFLFVPYLILSSISSSPKQLIFLVKNQSLTLPPTSALLQSSTVLEMVRHGSCENQFRTAPSLMIPDLGQAYVLCDIKPDQLKSILKEVKRIFKYLKGTINMGLWYPKDSGFELTAFSDADHAGCLDTRKSTSGGIQFLGDKIVCWMSRNKLNAMSQQQQSTVVILQVVLKNCRMRHNYKIWLPTITKSPFVMRLPQSAANLIAKRTSLYPKTFHTGITS
ncbi:hypothetical protein Tco_1509354 [Tanacetum coccineum]